MAAAAAAAAVQRNSCETKNSRKALNVDIYEGEKLIRDADD
jgi:hypothetical protein